MYETSTVSEKSQIGACKIVTSQKFSVESGTFMHTIQENALFSRKNYTIIHDQRSRRSQQIYDNDK